MLYNVIKHMSCCYIAHDYVMLYNTRYVICYETHVMLCYITHDILCYIPDMLCYITHVMLYDNVMLYNK